MKDEIKQKLNLLIKLDKAYTECHWDYHNAMEYKLIAEAARYARIERAIEKKCDEIWGQIADEYGMFKRWQLPREIHEYYENGRNKNKYDRFNNYQRDLERLGVELPD